MARKRFNVQTEKPIHIYGRSNNAEWFQPCMDTTWNIFNDFLNYVNHCYNLKIHAFVLMSNHYHLLASTPDKNLPLIMNRLHTEISIAMNCSSGRINHVFGGRYKACEIKNTNYLDNVIKYIYQNPVRAGLCDLAETYKYSTLSGLYGFSHLQLKIDRSYDEMLFKNLGYDYLYQIRELLPKESCIYLKKHLRRTVMDKIIDPGRRPVEL